MTELDAFPPIDDGFIDRIVDGALTTAELRTAVERLDRDPGGWKRCAVAFLEAQCLREALRLPDEPARIAISDRSLPASLLAAPPKRHRPQWLRSALAAGVLVVSFALGWLGHATRPGSSTRTASSQQPGPMVAHKTSEIDTRSEKAREIQTTPSAISDLRPLTGGRAPRKPTPRITTVARLRFGRENAQAEVPIVAGPGIDEQWLRCQPPPVSEVDRAIFEHHGYQVDQRRRLLTTITADGRRVAVPVDQVLIRYTGNQSL
jgi:hypothetical protein